MSKEHQVGQLEQLRIKILSDDDEVVGAYEFEDPRQKFIRNFNQLHEGTGLRAEVDPS